MPSRRGRRWLVSVALAVLVGACVTYRAAHPGRADRGVRVNHARHAEEEIACADCHSFEEGESAFPNHDLCGICHDIDEDAADKKECRLCHTKPDLTVAPRVQLLKEEIRFDHAPHIEKELECSVCHPDPDSAVLPKKALKPFCMDCHAATDTKLTDCAVCHSEIRKDTRPKFRGDVAISHDVPSLWDRTHGRESLVDPKFCEFCHEDESFCEDCHRKEAPDSHTLSWRRRTHGLQADWDRRSCAVCHEEDFCAKCHENTAPSSHRKGWRKRHGVEAAWNQNRCTVCHGEDSCAECHRRTKPASHFVGYGRPVNRHCLTCHYPPATSKCAMCHEDFTHPSAMPSPHNFGIYPPACGLCHPAGLPRQAPHPTNVTARCIACH